MFAMTATQEINLQPSHVKAYRFIEKYINSKIVSPEICEVARGVNITERHAYRIIGDLVALGYVSRSKHKKRSMKIEKPLQ